MGPFRGRGVALEVLENERDYLRTRCDRLTEALLSMKKQGYEYQGPAITDVPESSLPDEVLAAISETSGSNQELAYDQALYAQTLLDRGMSPEVVADEIRSGADMEIRE